MVMAELPTGKGQLRGNWLDLASSLKTSWGPDGVMELGERVAGVEEEAEEDAEGEGVAELGAE